MSVGTQPDWFEQNAPKKAVVKDWFEANAPQLAPETRPMHTTQGATIGPPSPRTAEDTTIQPSASPQPLRIRTTHRMSFGAPRYAELPSREELQVPLIKRITGKSLQEFIEPHLPAVGPGREFTVEEPTTVPGIVPGMPGAGFPGVAPRKIQAVSAPKGAVADAARLAAGLLDFFGSPEGIIAAAATMLPGGKVAVPAIYAAEQAAATPEAIQRYLDDPTPENLQQALLLPGFAALLGSAAGKALKGMAQRTGATTARPERTTAPIERFQEKVGAMERAGEGQARAIEGEALTAEFRTPSQKPADAGKAPIEEAPLFGGEKQLQFSRYKALSAEQKRIVSETVQEINREPAAKLAWEYDTPKSERVFDASGRVNWRETVAKDMFGEVEPVEVKPAAAKPSAPVVPLPAGYKRVKAGTQVSDQYGDTFRVGQRVTDTATGKRIRLDAILETTEGQIVGSSASKTYPLEQLTVRPKPRRKAAAPAGVRQFGETDIGFAERLLEPGYGHIGSAKTKLPFTRKPDIAQLAESVLRLPRQASPVQRMKHAEKLADSLVDIKDKAGNAARDVVAQGVAISDILLRPPKWTSFHDALGKFDGALQVNNRDLRIFSKKITEAFPDKLTREAITNWIQAEGKPEVLQERAAASKGSLRRGYEEALRLGEEEKKFAKNISNYFDGKLQEAIDASLLEQGVENYVNQIWHKADHKTANLLVAESKLRHGGYPSGKGLRPNPVFIKRRIFSSYFEGEQAGFKAKNKDIGFLVAAYDKAFNQAIFSRAFIKSLLDRKASDGRPIATVSGGGMQVPKGQQPSDAYLVFPKLRPEEAADYRPIDHPALRKWTWATKDEAGKAIFVQGDMLIHPEHHTHLKNVLSTSALRKSRIGRGVLRGVRELKSTLLSFSGFHQVQEGLHALGHKVVPFRTEKINLHNPRQRAFVEHGLEISSFDGAEMFAEGVHATGLVNRIPMIGPYLQRYTDWLFHEHIPELKMGLALEALERNKRRYPSLTESQVLKLTSDQANAAFGEMNYRMMGRNPTFQDILRLATLAPDFLEARARFVGQALKPYGREQAAALMRLSLGLWVTTRITNKIFDDDYHWDRPFSFIINGREFTLRTVPGDVMHLNDNPRNFIYWRINPTLTRPIIESLTGRDHLGRKRILTEQLRDWILGHVPIPLQFLTDGRDRKLWEGVLQSLGIGSFRYRTKAERLAGQYVGDLMPSRGMSREERERSRFRRQLIERIQDGDETAKKEAWAAVRDKTITLNDHHIIMRQAREPRIYNLVNRLPIEQAMDVWEEATEEERKIIRPLLLRKRSLIYKETPERRRVLIERLSTLLGKNRENRQLNAPAETDWFKQNAPQSGGEQDWFERNATEPAIDFRPAQQ